MKLNNLLITGVVFVGVSLPLKLIFYKNKEIMKFSDNLIISGASFIGTFISLELLDYYKNYRKINENDNTITIINDYCENINENTFVKFVNDYNGLNKDKDIHLIIHSRGGNLNSVEAICNCIMSHKGKGKIICYIPYFAFSGAFLISLFADKIIFSENTSVCAFDGQILIDQKIYSYSSIISTIEFKKANNNEIKENWLTTYEYAKKLQERQKIFLRKLENKYNEKTIKIMYEEFLSGKNNHDKTFFANEIIDLGINIEIIKEFPDFIKNIINQKIDLFL